MSLECANCERDIRAGCDCWDEKPPEPTFTEKAKALLESYDETCDQYREACGEDGNASSSDCIAYSESLEELAHQFASFLREVVES